jgi:hypothetical protein
MISLPSLVWANIEFLEWERTIKKLANNSESE